MAKKAFSNIDMSVHTITRNISSFPKLKNQGQGAPSTGMGEGVKHKISVPVNFIKKGYINKVVELNSAHLFRSMNFLIGPHGAVII